MIKADLKHWGGRRGVEGPYEIDYKRFARQVYDKLGDGGVVGVPNARGPDNTVKTKKGESAEYRFEELSTFAEKDGSITKLGDGRVFHDNEYNLWFVKGQEINSEFNKEKLTYLVFNVAFGKNFIEKDNQAFSYPDTIKILTLPSCIKQINNNFIDSPFFSYFDGIIVHSSSASKRVNECAEEFYNSCIMGNYFEDLMRTIHKIGAVAVSGGHRTPKEGLIQKVISPISIGSSYTPFLKFEGKDLPDFIYWLRTSIENSQNIDALVKGSNKREMLSKHLPRMIQGVLSGERKTIS